MAKITGIPLDEWSGAAATKQLHATIKEFNEQTSKQTRTIIRLTWAMLWLTAVMTLGLAVQIWLALR